MKKLCITLKDLFDLPTAVIYNPDAYQSATSVEIDSRKVKKGSLFVAIKGDRFDGHDFVHEAVKKGASSVVIEENKLNLFKSLSLPLVTVNDTVTALGGLARVWRNKLSAKVVALTGSSGKTSTKEILSDLLREKYSVNKTAANNNNQIGVPLTIFSTGIRHDILILEIGTNHFGEVAYSAGIAQPDFALITNIGNSHLEFLNNKRGVLKEKKELLNVTVSRKKFVFINIDDPLLSKTFNGYPHKISYGFNGKCDVKGKILRYDETGKPEFEIKYKNKVIRQTLPLYGEQSAKNYLAAAAVAIKLGVNKTEIQKAAGKLKAYDKRLNVKIKKNYCLIDDTYNANPDSMKYSLEVLGRMKKYKRKIAVLGDMLELGKESEKQHKKLSSVLIKNKIDTVYTVGKYMKFLDNEIKSSKISHRHFKNRNKLINVLKSADKIGAALLLKGSRGMKMEEFVAAVESGEVR